jgi:hypothetical protein
MAVRFRRISSGLREEGLDAAALSFLQLARGIVSGEPRALVEALGMAHLSGGHRAVALHASGPHMLIASSNLADIHPEEAMLDLMKRCGWGDFKYMYVEVEPCHGGALRRPQGGGCRDKFAVSLPRSQGIVFYTLADSGPGE